MTLLFDGSGQRKYLTPAQRQAFLGAARRAGDNVYTFCFTLGLTGCRISEALALTGNRIDLGAGLVLLESLKKRRRGIFRAIPVPPEFLQSLVSVHNLPTLGNERLWTWSRTTAWRRVKEIMQAADISGVCACPKGIRHAFGVKAVTSDVPLNMIQKWLGHSRLATTAIYTDAIGSEERQIAGRMWE